MSIEAMKAALEALKRLNDIDGMYSWVDTEQALRQAIEQAEQWDTSDMAHRSGGLTVEPPDYVEPVTTDYHEGWEEGFKAGNALVPPKREWIGLTDDEVVACWARPDIFSIAHAIEAKLKEKNT